MDSGSPSSPQARQPVQLPFALHSFAPPPASLALTGSVHREGDRLSLQYRLEDPEGLVLVPPATAAPRRCDELWTSTCFELFLAEPGTGPYWESNLSPSGDWNLYRLSGYRQGLAPEPAISALPFVVERERGGLDLRVDLDLGALPLAGLPLELAVTAVLELRDDEILYWALAHPGEQADFHWREGFGLRV
jgi:hypothetical protein